MSQELVAQLVEAGYSPAEIAALIEFYDTLNAPDCSAKAAAIIASVFSAKGEPTEGVKTAVVSSLNTKRDNKPRFSKTTKTNVRANTPSQKQSSSSTAAERIFNLAYSLFGGFTHSQVNRLIAVCRYKGVSEDALVALMMDLRNKHWQYGWIRTRDAVEALQMGA